MYEFCLRFDARSLGGLGFTWRWLSYNGYLGKPCLLKLCDLSALGLGPELYYPWKSIYHNCI